MLIDNRTGNWALNLSDESKSKTFPAAAARCLVTTRLQDEG